MTFIPAMPEVQASDIRPQDFGYTARVNCLVDGLPADIRMTVNTKYRERSDYLIRVFDPATVSWVQVYELYDHEVSAWQDGAMPIVGESPEGVRALQKVAFALREMADVVWRTARLRAVDTDIEAHIQRERAVLESGLLHTEWTGPVLEAAGCGCRGTDHEVHAPDGITPAAGVAEDVAADPELAAQG